MGIGITPNSQLAEAAGLEVGNGIVVDAGLRSADPDIYAAGDVANAYHPVLGRYVRVEHWANALHQPQTAARAMLGQDVAYDRVPYFYTDQYDLGMEYAGYVEPGGYDRVVFRGDVEHREFIAFWLQDGRVLAGMNVNIWDVNEVIQAIVRAGRSVDAPAGRPRCPPGGVRLAGQLASGHALAAQVVTPTYPAATPPGRWGWRGCRGWRRRSRVRVVPSADQAFRVQKREEYGRALRDPPPLDDPPVDVRDDGADLLLAAQVLDRLGQRVRSPCAA